MSWFSIFGSPQPATAMPPGVSDAGALGSNQSQFALADHTHASKGRKGQASIQSNVATYTWVYPVAFGAGVVPICNGIAQTAAGITDLVNVQIEGAPTNTQCVFRVARYSRSFLSLLGIDILGFNSGAIPITLHMLALEP
jgi:hypothetical protein